jgi:hypothetical protein
MAALNIQRHIPLTIASKKLGKSHDYMSQYARTKCKEPHFSDGLKWLDLHLDLCGIEKHKKLLQSESILDYNDVYHLN